MEEGGMGKWEGRGMRGERGEGIDGGSGEGVGGRGGGGAHLNTVSYYREHTTSLFHAALKRKLIPEYILDL